MKEKITRLGIVTGTDDFAKDVHRLNSFYSEVTLARAYL